MDGLVSTRRKDTRTISYKKHSVVLKLHQTLPLSIDYVDHTDLESYIRDMDPKIEETPVDSLIQGRVFNTKLTRPTTRHEICKIF